MSGLFVDSIKKMCESKKDKLSFHNIKDKTSREAILSLKKQLEVVVDNFRINKNDIVNKITLDEQSALYKYAEREGFETKAYMYLSRGKAILKLAFLDEGEPKVDKDNWPKEFLRNGEYFIGSKNNGKYRFCYVQVTPGQDRNNNYICNDGFQIENNSDIEVVNSRKQRKLLQEENYLGLDSYENLNQDTLCEKKLQDFIYDIYTMESALNREPLDKMEREVDNEIRKKYKEIQEREK